MAIVSVVNMKGGVAKTTLAVNLADCLVRREDKSVLLIDLDPQFNATQCLFSGEEYAQRLASGAHTITNIFDDAPPPTVSVVTGSTAQRAVELKDIEPWRVKDGFDLVAGNLELHRLDMAPGQGREHRIKRFLDEKKAEERYDIVLIDTPPTPSAWMMSGLLASTHYLVPVKPEPLSSTGIDLLRGVIRRCSDNYAHPVECLGVVFTIAEEHTIVYREALSLVDDNAFWKGKRFAKSLPKRTVVARGQRDQQLILDLGDSALNFALTGIAGEFLERLGR